MKIILAQWSLGRPPSLNSHSKSCNVASKLHFLTWPQLSYQPDFCGSSIHKSIEELFPHEASRNLKDVHTQTQQEVTVLELEKYIYTSLWRLQRLQCSNSCLCQGTVDHLEVSPSTERLKQENNHNYCHFDSIGTVQLTISVAVTGRK